MSAGAGAGASETAGLLAGAGPASANDSLDAHSLAVDGSRSDNTNGSCGGQGTAHGASSTWEHRRAPLDRRFILGAVLRQRGNLLVAGAALLLCVAANLASPVLSGALFETLIQGQPFSRYKALLALLAVSYVGEPLLSQVYVRQATAAAEKVQAELRIEAFRVLLMQRIEFFDVHRTSELTTLLTKHLSSIRQFVFGNVTRDRGARAILEALGSVIVLFSLSWRLGPLLATVIITTAATAFLYRQQTKAVEAAHASAQVSMAQVADEVFSNIRLVRVFAGEAVEQQRWAQQVAASFRSGMGFSKAKATMEWMNRSLVHCSMLCLYALGGWLIAARHLSPGILVTCIGFTYSLVFATQGALQTFADARNTLIAVRRVQELLSELPEDYSMAAALPPGAPLELDVPGLAGASSAEASEQASARADSGSSASTSGESGRGAGRAVRAARAGDIELRGVTFAYPTRPQQPVLRNLSLTLPRGKVTALVGRSGTGKSTVAALLQRIYAVDSGAILCNGINIADFSREEWVEAVAAVSQEPVLWSQTSIRANIMYGRHSPCSEGEVLAAAEAAHALEIVEALPEGLDTIVSGSLLSGGERQRIALARALLKDSPIVVLDEATSALDAQSEAAVHAGIESLAEGRTVLVIAHRLSTVRAAHQIIVLQNGVAAEVGTHAELVRRGGLYADLVNSQHLAEVLLA